MLHQIVGNYKGDIPIDVTGHMSDLLSQFINIVAQKVQAAGIKRAVVRSMLDCSTIYVLDSLHLFVAAQKQLGMPSFQGWHHRDEVFTIDAVYEAAKWEIGFDEPFVIAFPAELLYQPADARAPALEAIATAHINSEFQRVERQMSIIQVNPIFGPASYAVDPRLVFVLMPFKDDLTRIYNEIVKPSVEALKFGLICRRADDIKSTKAFMQDIWKSTCEARLVIADLSELNPNVMYELGIAHTLGKETILIYQRATDVKFPADLAHIRRIEYNNDMADAKKLERDLKATIESVLEPAAIGPK
jgi:hypothetical protein